MHGASRVQHRTYDAIWDALVQHAVGAANAKTAGDLALLAGVEKRSCGTKLAAMSKGGYGDLGLRWQYVEAKRQRVWWRDNEVEWIAATQRLWL